MVHPNKREKKEEEKLPVKISRILFILFIWWSVVRMCVCIILIVLLAICQERSMHAVEKSVVRHVVVIMSWIQHFHAPSAVHSSWFMILNPFKNRIDFFISVGRNWCMNVSLNSCRVGVEQLHAVTHQDYVSSRGKRVECPTVCKVQPGGAHRRILSGPQQA